MDIHEDGAGREQGVFLPVFNVYILDFDALGKFYENLTDRNPGFELSGKVGLRLAPDNILNIGGLYQKDHQDQNDKNRQQYL